MLFVRAGMGLLVLLVVHNFKSLVSFCFFGFFFKKTEAKSWGEKKVNFALNLTILFLFILFLKSH